MSTDLTDTDNKFMDDVWAELARARHKFPGGNLTLAALTEEVGELAQAALHIYEGKEADWQRVWAEAVQVAVMACRMATEGDASIATPPPSIKKP